MEAEKNSESTEYHTSVSDLSKHETNEGSAGVRADRRLLRSDDSTFRESCSLGACSRGSDISSRSCAILLRSPATGARCLGVQVRFKGTSRSRQTLWETD